MGEGDSGGKEPRGMEQGDKAGPCALDSRVCAVLGLSEIGRFGLHCALKLNWFYGRQG
jgi:hypothetical protein